MTEYRKNILSGLIFLVIGIVVLVATPLAVKDPQVSAVGPRAFPSFIGGAMVALSLALIGQAIYRQHKAGLPLLNIIGERRKDADEKREGLKNETRAFIALAIMLIYAILFDKIGYFASTFLAITAYLLLLRVKSVWSYAISYAVGGAIWAAFTYLLSVRLP
ncbi:MAG: tripartite tricarboxylate transporter TctB family protein [Clostridia bacterium]|nr:tripartite tricarboxylate transporter TctB family protein [Clostridia bacterium]